MSDSSNLDVPARRLPESVRASGDGLGQVFSLPAGLGADGTPVGPQAVAAHGREDVLLRVAALGALVPPMRSPIARTDVPRPGGRLMRDLGH